MQDKIMALEALLLEKTGERSQEILESEGLALRNIPVKYSLSINETLYQAVKKVALEAQSKNIEDKSLDLLQKIILQSASISEGYIEYKNLVSKVKNKIIQQASDLVTEDELLKNEQELTSVEMFPSEFYENEEKLYQEIIRVNCTNAAIKSGKFLPQAEIKISELEKENSRLAQHAKKTAFDQVCLMLFGHHAGNYDKLDMYEVVHHKHELMNLIPIKLKNYQAAFAYISLEPMAMPEFPRFAKLLNKRDGFSYEVVEKDHFMQDIEVTCQIAGNEVKVAVPVWFGIIIGDKTDGRALDFDQILGEAKKVAQENKDSKHTSNKFKDNSLGQGYLEVVSQIASSTNSNYGERYMALKEKAMRE